MNGGPNQRTWPVLFSVWASFFLYGAIASPIPGVNEPHYLCKARHFWQPDWCSQDFFLASPNAHTVFYVTIGGLTNVFSFEQSAWIGRLLAMFVLAWGWSRCHSMLFLTRWAILWCAWIFLALNSCGNFSGEWLVGGVEGKVFCYGFLLASFGEVLRNRWLLASTWCGLSVSFHPVVGIWALLAFSLSSFVGQVWTLIQGNRLSSSLNRSIDEIESRLTSSSIQKPISILDVFRRIRVLPLVVLAVVALPGLIPVVRLLMESVPAQTRYAGTYLQVYFRLAHHLDPMRFLSRAYLGYAGLLAFWLASLRWSGRSNTKRALDGIVAWAVIFAVVGIMIGLGPRPPKLMPYFAERMNLLKFYPFRLADVLVPLVCSVSLMTVLERTAFYTPLQHDRRFSIRFSFVIMVLVLLTGLCRASAVSETNRYATLDRADWLDVCRWVDSNLPADAVVQSPTNGWAFKWFARRAEYVAFKDCPQDAAGIVEWNRRLNFLQRWYEQNYKDGIYSASELVDLRQKTGLTHLLTDRLGPFELEPVYRNGTFQVYDLTNVDGQR